MVVVQLLFNYDRLPSGALAGEGVVGRLPDEGLVGETTRSIVDVGSHEEPARAEVRRLVERAAVLVAAVRTTVGDVVVLGDSTRTEVRGVVRGEAVGHRDVRDLLVAVDDEVDVAVADLEAELVALGFCGRALASLGTIFGLRLVRFRVSGLAVEPVQRVEQVVEQQRCRDDECPAAEPLEGPALGPVLLDALGFRLRLGLEALGLVVGGLVVRRVVDVRGVGVDLGVAVTTRCRCSRDDRSSVERFDECSPLGSVVCGRTGARRVGHDGNVLPRLSEKWVNRDTEPYNYTIFT